MKAAVWLGVCVGALVVTMTVGGCDEDPNRPFNTAPVACFSVSPGSGTTETEFQLDGSCSTDQQDPVAALEVRWDWESDGTWDTPFTPVKAATHRFESLGTRTIRMQVQDTGGGFGLAQKDVAVAASSPPACLVNPAQLTFGTVALGESRGMGFWIKNTGGGILTGSVGGGCPAFSITSGAGSYALASGQETQISVRFSPTTARSSSCIVDLGSAACQVICTGTGSNGPLPPRDMMLVPEGVFTMGSPGGEPGRWPNETEHQVTLTKAFYMCDHEVTQTEWRAVMGWDESFRRGADRPVEQVTWFDCIQYCNRRSAREGLDSAYVMTGRSYSGSHITRATVAPPDWSRNGYRLPTEAEWEYACRAGSTTSFSNGSIVNAGWNCGDDPVLDRVGWYCGNSDDITHTVKGRNPNALGLYDMHGNVWEWCWDFGDRGDYVGGPVTDPTGMSTGIDRVTRGGGWGSHAAGCRSAMRSSVKPGEGNNALGLRLARTVP